MPNLIRVELHHTGNYEPLHVALARRGIARTVKSDDGTLYNLPTGTYYFAGESTTTNTRAAVAAVAIEIGHPNASIIVCDASKGCAWQGLPEVAAIRKGA